MKKLLTAIILFVSIHGYALDEKQIREWEKTTWRLSIGLKSEKAYGGAVQFAIMDKDPREAFKKDYTRIKDLSIKEKRYDQDSELSIKLVAWDIQFREMPGDEVYLLVKSDMNGFSSNKPDGQYYFVTKTTLIKDTPSVWFIPVKVMTGREMKILLDDSNVISLDDLVK